MGTSPENALSSFDLDLLLGPASASISENTELDYKILDTGKFETTHYDYQAQTIKKSEATAYNYQNQNSGTTNYDFLALNTETSPEYQYQAENLSNGLITSNGFQSRNTGNEFSLQVDVVNKSEYDTLDNKFMTLSNNYVSLKNDYDTQMKDYAKVQRQFANLAADYAKLHELNKENAMECLKVTSKCQELQKQILNYQATIKASQEHRNKLDLDIYAQSRQFVQYQSLVDELQNQNTDLKTEVKNEKINGRDGRKMISALTNNNKTLTEHLCWFACIIEGRKQLDKESRGLIKKYCKKRNRKNIDLDSIENQSVDTGRASSLASSDGEPSFLSPAYSYNFSPFSSSSIIMKSTKDASSSPPPGVKTMNISTSPIIFEERLSVPLNEIFESQTPEDNSWDVTPSPIQLNNISIAKTTMLNDANTNPINTTNPIKTIDKMTPIKAFATNLMKIDMNSTTANAKTLKMSTGSIEFSVSIPLDTTISDAASREHNDTQVFKLQQPVEKTIKKIATNAEHKNTVPEPKVTDITNIENNDAEVINSKKFAAKTISDITSPGHKETKSRKSKKSMTNIISDITNPEHQWIEARISKKSMTDTMSDKSMAKTVIDITSPEHIEVKVPKSKKSKTNMISDITYPEHKETEACVSKKSMTNTMSDITSPEHKETEARVSKMSVTHTMCDKSMAKTIIDVTSPEHIETEVLKSKKSMTNKISDITNPEHKETEAHVSKTSMTNTMSDKSMAKTVIDVTSPELIEVEVPKSKKSMSNIISGVTNSEHKETEACVSKKSMTNTISDITSPEHTETKAYVSNKSITNTMSDKSMAKTIKDVTSLEHIEAEVPKSKKSMTNIISDITSPEHDDTEASKSEKSLAQIKTDITSSEHIEAEAPKYKKSAAKTLKDIPNLELKDTNAPKFKKSVAKTITDITSPETEARKSKKVAETLTDITIVEHKETELPKSKKSMAQTITDVTSAKNNDSQYPKSKKIRTKSPEAYMKENLSHAKTKLSLACPIECADTETRVTRLKTVLAKPNNQGYASPRITRSKSIVTSPIEHHISTTRLTRSDAKSSCLINYVNASPRITRSKSAITSPVKHLDYKNRRVTFTDEISVLCEPINVTKLIHKQKLDMTIPMDSSQSRILTTPKKTSTGSPSKDAEIKTLAVKHKSDVTTPIAHMNDTARLTRSRSNTLNFSLSPIESFSRTPKTRSKMGITSSVVCSDLDPRTPVNKSGIGYTSPIKSLNTETLASTTSITSLIKHTETRISLFKESSDAKTTESDSKIETSPDKRTTVNKKAQRRTRRITRSNSSNISLTENNNISTRVTRSKSGIISPLKCDIRPISELETGDTKTSMTKAKIPNVTNESCDKRTPLVQQKIDTLVKHSDSIRVTRSNASLLLLSPVIISNTKSSKSDSFTAKPSPIHSIGLISPTSKSKTRNTSSIDLISHASKSKSGGTSQIKLDMRQSISEFETDDANINMDKAKAPEVNTEKVANRTPVERLKIDTISPIIHSEPIRVTQSKTGILSPVKNADMRSSESDSLTAKTIPSQMVRLKTRNTSSIGLTSPAPKSNTGITSLIKLDMRPPMSEFETDVAKTIVAKAKASDVTIESFDKRTPVVLLKMDDSLLAMHYDSIRMTKYKTDIISPVKFMDLPSQSNSINPVTSPIQSIDFRPPKSKTGPTSSIELAANVKESMYRSKTDLNISIDNPDTTPCMPKTKKITNNSKSENMVPKNIVVSHCDTRSIDDNVDNSVPVTCKEITEKLNEIETLQLNEFHNDADNDLEIDMILRKCSIDWAMLSPLSLSPVDIVNQSVDKQLKTVIKDGTAMVQNTINDELVESLQLSDEDSEDDINREDDHFSELIVENQHVVAGDFIRKDVVENNTRNSRFEDNVFEPLDECPASKIYGTKYKKLSKLQKIYKANVRKNIQLIPTMKKQNKPKAYSISTPKLGMIVTNKEKSETGGKKMLFKETDAHIKDSKEKINNKDILKETESKKSVEEPKSIAERSSCIPKNSQPEFSSKTTECKSRETSSSIKSSFSRIRTKPLPHCGRKKQVNDNIEFIKPNLNTISEYESSLPLESIRESDISNISFAIPSRKRISRVTKTCPPNSSCVQTDNSDNTKDKSDINHNDFDSESPPMKKIKVANSEIQTKKVSQGEISSIQPWKNRVVNAEKETKESRIQPRNNKLANAATENKNPSIPPQENKVVNAETETKELNIPSRRNKVSNAEIKTMKRSIPPQKLQDTTTDSDIEILSSHSRNSTKDKEHQLNNSPNNAATVPNDSNSCPKDQHNNIKKKKVVCSTSNVPPSLPPTDQSRHCTDYNDINIFTSQNNKSLKKQNAIILEQWTHNILDSMILKYGSTIKSFKKPKYDDSLCTQIVKGIENCVKHSQVPDKYFKSVQAFAYDLKSVSQERIISGLMTFFNDPVRKKEIQVVNRFQQNEPTVTKTEKVLIDLIESLENSGLTLWELVLDGLEYILFTLEKGATPSFHVVDSVAHFYANVCKYLSKTSRLWMFMLNAMYCLSFKAIPLIKHCLDVKPNLLPYANRYIDPGLAPVIRCFVFLLHFYKCDDPFKRVDEIRIKLKNKYHYQLQDENETTLLFMCKQCISNLPDRKLNKDMLELVLLVLAKRRGTSWCHKNLVQKILLPMIKGEIDISYAGRRFCISTIGNLVKPYKNEMTVYSEEVVNLLLNMFETTLSHEIKEDIIRSLINMNMKRIAERIDKCLFNWNPPTVSAELERVLKDYVQMRPIKSWQTFHRNQLK